jgi:flagellar hook-associated protein 2
MSFTGATTSATSSAPTGTLGDIPPVSFPGIASGIDYNAIIQKYTAATQAQEVPYNNQLNRLTAANTEILKIQNLLGTVQDSMTALSNPSTFQAYTGTPSTAGVATLKQVAGQNAVIGTYTIQSQTAATSTAIVNDSNANGKYTLAQYGTSAPAFNAIGASISPSNGTLANGLPAGTAVLTVNGVKISYDVSTDSLKAILDRITASTAGVNATYNANGTVTLAATTAAGISLGSAGDNGNLVQALHIDTAQIVGAGAAETITSSAPVVGINQFATLNGTGNAGFATAVTSGTFTINGTQITINASTQSVNDVLTLINTSAAGVSASFNGATDNIVLTNKIPGNQNIVLGSGTDTSNFLGVSGLSNATGLTPTLHVGTQAKVTYTDPTGAPVTVYSATNDFTSVVPGMTLTVTGTTATPYTVNVANDPTTAEAAIAKFVTAYNAAIQELSNATAPPIVATGTNSSTGKTASTQATGGGPLFRNFEVSGLRDQLVQMVSGFIPSGSTSYNSLQSIGLSLDTASTSAGAVTADSLDATSTTDTKSTQNLSATSGKLQILDKTKFEAALAANPAAVQALFTAPTGSLTQTLGAQLTIATGLPTFLNHRIASSVPSSALLTNIEDSNSFTITSLKQQIKLIEDEANQQANRLRTQFTASETLIAQLQGLQTQIAAIGH